MSQSPFSQQGSNPYQSPAPPVAAPETLSPQPGVVSTRCIELLQATRPWVRFLSIIGYIGAALMMLGGLVMAALSMSGQGAAAMGGGVAVAYIVIGVLYIIGAGFLGSYASRIRDLESSRRMESLEEAMAAQKSFWRFTGILMAVVTVLYAVILLFAVIAALVGALR